MGNIRFRIFNTVPPLLAIYFLVALLFPAWQPAEAAFQNQVIGIDERAPGILESLTPEERVGQLFLVNFNGTSTGPESDIYELIHDYHIGGVILTADNENIDGTDDTLNSILELNRNLQEAWWLAAQDPRENPITNETYQPDYVPMLIGVEQSGDGYPFDQIYDGLTALPSPMAIGATWKPALAEQVGTIFGRELSALGFNLFLGPSLDVIDFPETDSTADLAVQSFGGDPFWVAQMGSAFISGVHRGSEQKMLVVSKHFPGVGGSDRPLAEEISTVRKSLEQLKQIELAPFSSVTGKALSSEATTDALLISHIRYQGFLGNIRASTRPISFDEKALAEILSLEEFASWHESGGLIITDNLGSRAVRRFYDPANLDFNARLVVRDAFIAGSDILYLGNILDTGDPDAKTTATRIIAFFTQKYREDLAFAERVDESVLRVLSMKLRIFDDFELGNTLPDIQAADLIGAQEALTFDVARQGATLISPTFADLDAVIPGSPTLNDRIVFVTDSLSYQQCSACPVQFSPGDNAFQQAVLRLYGLEAGNQILRQNLFSYSFEDLMQMLVSEDSGFPIESSIRGAEWVVLAIQDISPSREASNALRKLLAERDDLLRGKNVIVFAMSAPYYLDATEISKLDAYYGLFGKTPQFIDTAARILFKEFTPSFGSLPVSVPGIGYDLISITSPDPSQVVRVQFDIEEEPIDPGIDTPEPTPIAQLQLGDQIQFRTGLILDHNGNPVPDGTPVQFVLNLSGVETLLATVETEGGIARTSYRSDSPGALVISFISEPQPVVEPLLIEIPIPEGFETQPPPTESPTPLPTETATPPPTQPAVIFPTPPPPEPRTQTDFIDWGLSILVTISIGLIAYRLGIVAGNVRWSIRWALCAVIGGLLTYLYIAAGFPGSLGILGPNRGGILWIALLGSAIGWSLGLLWRSLENRYNASPPSDPPDLAETKTG